MVDTRNSLLLLVLAVCVPSLGGWTLEQALSSAATAEGFVELFDDAEAVEDVLEDRTAMRRICNAFRSRRHNQAQNPSGVFVEKAGRVARFLLQSRNVDECRKSGSYVLYLFGATDAPAVLEAALEQHRYILWVKKQIKQLVPSYDLKPISEELFAQLRPLVNSPFEFERVLRIFKLYLAAHDEKEDLELPPQLVVGLLRVLIEAALQSGDADLSATFGHEELENLRTGRLDALISIAGADSSVVAQAAAQRLDLFVKTASTVWLRGYAKKAPDAGQSLLNGRSIEPVSVATAPSEPAGNYADKAHALKEKLRAMTVPLAIPLSNNRLFHLWLRYLDGASSVASPEAGVVAQVLLLLLDPEPYRASVRIRKLAAEVLQGWRLVEETKSAVSLAEFFDLFFRKPEPEVIDAAVFYAFIDNYGQSVSCIDTALRAVERDYLTEAARKHLRTVEVSQLSPSDRAELLERAQSMLRPALGKRLFKRAATPVQEFIGRLGGDLPCAQKVRAAG